MIEHLTDDELVHYVDNKPDATPLERELAERLDAALEELKVMDDPTARKYRALQRAFGEI